MAYSDTISTTVFNTRKVIDSAIRRCKTPAQLITAEHISIANDQLYLFLSNLANEGTPLWCIEKQIYPLYEGVDRVTLDIGTVDVLNANLRTLREATGTDTDSSTIHQVFFDDYEVAVTTVGILWSGASAPVALERSDDGATWTTIQSETPDAVSGEWTWYDMDAVIESEYFRVRATSGVLSFDTIYLGNTPSEIPVARINRDDFTSLPNKSMQSQRPLQYWFDRQVNRPVMRLWPVPNEAAEAYQIVLWRARHIMDVGTMRQELEVPQRWYDAVVWGLAAKLAWELPDVDPKFIPALETKAAQAMAIVQNEERDNSPTYIAPDISAYTR